MRWMAEIVVVQDVDPRIVPEMDASLEVSLDCVVCRRYHRTVRFSSDTEEARCNPGHSARHLGPHAFPGRLVGVSVERRSDGFDAIYKIEYDSRSFVDEKTGRNDYQGHPTWARVKWEVSCPQCGERSRLGTQTNLGRPLRERCRCSLVLQREHRELPVLRYRGPGEEGWREVAARFGVDQKPI